MAPSLFSLFRAFLEERPDQRFTGQEIAAKLVEEHDRLADKRVQQVAAEIASNYAGTKNRNKLPPQLRVTADRPREFYWTNRGGRDGDVGEDGNASEQNSTSLDEQSLYPILIQYMDSEFPDMWSCRINEATSSNKRGKGANEWLHPDVVGRQLLSTRWERDVQDLASNGQKIRLWSFEVKTSLEKGNVRSAFFQAVANSSWANYAYLAAEVIEQEAHDELQLLSPLHGVGLIRIDRERPTDSQVMLAARERRDFDLPACNRLAKENGDFKEFMRVIADELKTNRPIGPGRS
ncbi:MAG: hypothetical protein OXE58_14075 [Acidobacteria bacterium]|nr:hypothetical protein [Acidobacteriota bacterium]